MGGSELSVTRKIVITTSRVGNKMSATNRVVYSVT
jgi:hypothetical protein